MAARVVFAGALARADSLVCFRCRSATGVRGWTEIRRAEGLEREARGVPARVFAFRSHRAGALSVRARAPYRGTCAIGCDGCAVGAATTDRRRHATKAGIADRTTA